MNKKKEKKYLIIEPISEKPFLKEDFETLADEIFQASNGTIEMRDHMNEDQKSDKSSSNPQMD
jgi:uncharacterized protein YydD (DUF2326 family)